MTPKSLLRHPAAHSSFDDFLPGTSFKRLIPENVSDSVNPIRVERMIFCSGKIFYDLAKERDAQKLNEKIVIHRLEQVFIKLKFFNIFVHFLDNLIFHSLIFYSALYNQTII